MTESAALFKRCMLDAAAADMKELDAEMMVPTDFSAAHARKMSVILGFRVHSHSIAKRALIIIIAAAFLLTGCTVAVYFGTSRNVEVVIGTGSVTVTFSGDGVTVYEGKWQINEYMEPGYMPEGFELVGSNKGQWRHSLVYRNPNIGYGMISIEQFVASKIRYSFSFNEKGDLYKIYYKDYEILTCDNGDGGKTYCWTDGDYGYFMHFMFPTERDDMAIRIIEGLRLITPPEDAENGEIS